MKFAEITPDQLDPEPNGFAQISASQLDPEPEQIGPGETFLANASNVFGAGPALVGALAYVTGKGDYTQYRDAMRARTEEANAQNPRAATAGKFTAILPETILGGAVGKVAGVGAKAVGLAEKVAPFVKANPLISSVLEGAGTGAAYGGASGAGEALSEGKDIGEGALKGAEGGAAVGGAFGAVTGGIAKAAKGAVERVDSALVPGVTDALAGSERSEIVSALRKDPELRAIASKPVAEAVAGLEEKSATLRNKAEELISQIDSKSIGLPIGKFAAAIDSEIAKLSRKPLQEPIAKALENVKESALKAWIPSDLSAALSSPAAKESELFRNNLLKRRDVASIPLSKLEELSEELRNLPGSAEIKKEVSDVIRSVRDAHLTDISHKAPEVKTAIDSLRDLDKDFEVISRITGTLKDQPATSHGGLEKLISLFTHHGPIGAAAAFASGHPIPAVALAAPAVAKKGTELLAWLQREAAAGNQKAIKAIKAADIARTVGTTAAGVAGSTQSGTLATLQEGSK